MSLPLIKGMAKNLEAEIKVSEPFNHFTMPIYLHPLNPVFALSLYSDAEKQRSSTCAIGVTRGFVTS